MSDPAEDILDRTRLSRRLKASAWDMFYQNNSPDELRGALDALPLDEATKSALFNAKFPTGEAAQQGNSALWRIASNAGELLNPVTTIKGLAGALPFVGESLGGPGFLATGKALLSAQGEQFHKAGHALRRAGEAEGLIGKAAAASEAIGHGMAGALPIAGPIAVASGEQMQQGDIAGGLGKAIGLLAGAGLAGPVTRATGRAVRPIATRTGEALYQSALKPTKAVLKDVRTPVGAGADAARKTLVRTGLEEGIPITARGARKVENLIDSLNGEVQSRLASAQTAGKTVDPITVEQAISDVAKDFTRQINAQPELAAIETVRKNFMTNPEVARTVQGPAGTATVTRDIPVEIAQDMKVNTYKGLRGKYGRELSGTIEAEKAGARKIREGIEQAAPDVAGLNAREGALIPLKEAIADAMRRRGNYHIFGLTPMVASIPAITHGHAWPLLAALVDRAPGVISRTGIWINRTGTRSGRITQTTGQAAVAGYAMKPEKGRPTSRRGTQPALITP